MESKWWWWMTPGVKYECIPESVSSRPAKRWPESTKTSSKLGGTPLVKLGLWVAWRTVLQLPAIADYLIVSCYLPWYLIGAFMGTMKAIVAAMPITTPDYLSFLVCRKACLVWSHVQCVNSVFCASEGAFRESLFLAFIVLGRKEGLFFFIIFSGTR